MGGFSSFEIWGKSGNGLIGCKLKRVFVYADLNMWVLNIYVNDWVCEEILGLREIQEVVDFCRWFVYTGEEKIDIEDPFC